MKFDAHPLLVAVAMGLLNPAALVAEVEEDEEENVPDGFFSSPSGADDRWDPRFPEPDAAELHRVEIEWLKSQG